MILKETDNLIIQVSNSPKRIITNPIDIIFMDKIFTENGIWLASNIRPDYIELTSLMKKQILKKDLLNFLKSEVSYIERASCFE